MCNNDNDSCKQIAEILAIISVLQQNACNSETCLDTCDRGFLGCGTSSLTCNTRPVQLYLCNGEALSLQLKRIVQIVQVQAAQVSLELKN